MKRCFLYCFLALLSMVLLAGIILLGLLFTSSAPSAVAHKQHHSLDDLSVEILKSSPCQGVSQAHYGSWNPIYVVVITAMEAWTSVNSFAFIRCCLDNRFILQKADYFTSEASIIRYVKSSRKVLHLLHPLITRAERFVPKEAQSVTPVLFRATSVLRELVSEKEIHRLLRKTRSVLRHSPFQMRSRDTTVMAPGDEAADLWLSAVFLTGRFYQANPSPLAVVDLSGGSLLVAVPVTSTKNLSLNDNYIPDVPGGAQFHFDGESGADGKSLKETSQNEKKKRGTRELGDPSSNGSQEILFSVLLRKLRAEPSKKRLPETLFKRFSQKKTLPKTRNGNNYNQALLNSIYNSKTGETPFLSKNSANELHQNNINILRTSEIANQNKERLDSGNHLNYGTTSGLDQQIANLNPSEKDPSPVLRDHEAIPRRFHAKHLVYKPVLEKGDKTGDVTIANFFNKYIVNNSTALYPRAFQSHSTDSLILDSKDKKSLSKQGSKHEETKKANSHKNSAANNMFLTRNTIKTNNADKLKTMFEFNATTQILPNFEREEKSSSNNERIRNSSFLFTDFNYRGPLSLEHEGEIGCLIMAPANKRNRERTRQINKENNSKKYFFIKITKDRDSLLNNAEGPNKLKANWKIKEQFWIFKAFEATFRISCKKGVVFPKIVTLKGQLDPETKYSPIKLESLGLAAQRWSSKVVDEAILSAAEAVNNFSVSTIKIIQNLDVTFVRGGKLNSDDASYYLKKVFREKGANYFIYGINNAENLEENGGKNLHNVNFDAIFSQVYESQTPAANGVGVGVEGGWRGKAGEGRTEDARPKRSIERRRIKRKGESDLGMKETRISTMGEWKKKEKLQMERRKGRKLNEVINKNRKKGERLRNVKGILITNSSGNDERKGEIKYDSNLINDLNASKRYSDDRRGAYFPVPKPPPSKKWAEKMGGKNEKFADKLGGKNKETRKSEPKSKLSHSKAKRDIKSETKAAHGGTMSANCLDNKTNRTKTKGNSEEKRKTIIVSSGSQPSSVECLWAREFLRNKALIRKDNCYLYLLGTYCLNAITGPTRGASHAGPFMCSWENIHRHFCKFLISLIRGSNITAAWKPPINCTGLKMGVTSKARAQHEAEIGGEVPSPGSADPEQRQKPLIKIVLPGKWPRIKIVEPRKWPGIKTPVHSGTPTRGPVIERLRRLPSNSVKDYRSSTNFGVNDRSKLPATKFATKVNSQSIRKITSETLKDEEERHGQRTKKETNQKHRRKEEKNDQDVTENSLENNYGDIESRYRGASHIANAERTPLKAERTSLNAERTPLNARMLLNNNRISENRIRKTRKKRKRETGNQERNQVNNITSRCFAGNRIWLFATSFPLGIFPARVSVLLGAEPSSSSAPPVRFQSMERIPLSGQEDVTLSRDVSSPSKRRSDISPEADEKREEEAQVIEATLLPSLEPQGPGPPLKSTSQTQIIKDIIKENHLQVMSTPKSGEESTKESPSVTFMEEAPQKTPLWTKETLQNIKGVVDSILTAIGSSTDATTPTLSSSLTSSHNISRFTAPSLNISRSTKRAKKKYKLKDNSKSYKSTQVQTIITNQSLVDGGKNVNQNKSERFDLRRVHPRGQDSFLSQRKASNKDKTPQGFKNIVKKARKRIKLNKKTAPTLESKNTIANNSQSNGDPDYNNQAVSVSNGEEQRGIDELQYLSFNGVQNIKTSEETNPDQIEGWIPTIGAKLGSISSVTDMLFTVPNIQIANPNENTLIDSEIKSTEKLIRSSLTGFLKFVGPNELSGLDWTNKMKSEERKVQNWTKKIKTGSSDIPNKIAFPILGLSSNGLRELERLEPLPEPMEPLIKPVEELILKSSCIPVGSKGRFTIDDIRYTVVGTGNGFPGAGTTTTCWQEVTRIVDKHFSAPSVEGMDFLASTAFYYVASRANLIKPKSHFGTSMPGLFKKAAEEMCSRPPENLPDPMACLDYQFVAAILLRGFHLPEDKEIMVCDAVGDFEINSALGAAVNFLQRQRY